MMDTTPDRYAVLGHPVAHSRSPEIHAAFARQTGHRLEYGRIDCGPDGFERELRRFAASAGARGCNVTLPFKLDALSIATQASDRAQLAGAANTLRFDGDVWIADNTDGAGLVRDIEVHAGVPVAGRRVLLVGAGGGGAGALGPLVAARPACVVIANRSPARAAALAERHRGMALPLGVALTAAGLDTFGTADDPGPAGGYDIVVNASASSLAGLASPVPACVLKPGALAVDMMYGPPAAGFLRWARSAGATARDGLGMLVEQAAEAFFVWRGVRPDTVPVLEALRAQVDGSAPGSGR